MKITLLHGYSDSNKGDLAIVLGTLRLFEEIFDRPQITLQSVYSRADPDFDFHHRFMRKRGIRVLSHMIPSPYLDSDKHTRTRNLKAALRLVISAAAQLIAERSKLLARFIGVDSDALDNIRDCDLVVLKGGQYIYNDQGGLRGALYLWRILSTINLAARLGKPVLILGQSIGPLAGDLALEMTRRALKKCKAIIVREKLSEELMTQLGLGARTRRSPDLAFLVRPEESARTSALVAAFQKQRTLGMTVVDWSFPGSKDPKGDRERYVDALIQLAVYAFNELGMGVALFPQVIVRHHGGSDSVLIGEIKKKLADLGVTAHAPTEDFSPGELSNLYGHCTALIGTRLHSCILAAVSACPIVAIRYQGFKTEGVMAELGMERFVHDIGSVSFGELKRSLDEVLDNRALLTTNLIAAVERFRNEIQSTFSDLIRSELSIDPLHLTAKVAATL